MVTSEWLAIDLGAGEREALSLALDYPECIILLDDALARRIAGAAGMTVWGTLRVTVEAKRVGLVSEIKPTLAALRRAGMWFSTEIEDRVLRLAGEA